MVSKVVSFVLSLSKGERKVFRQSLSVRLPVNPISFFADRTLLRILH